MSDILQTIKRKLREAFAPDLLVVEDESHQHAGHRGAAEHRSEHGDTVSHIHIAITADAFAPMNRLARHRAVMDAIADEVKVLHAIRMSINA